jgi:hypothetical protein
MLSKLAFEHIPVKTKGFQRIFCCYGNVVEVAEAHGMGALCMVTRRPEEEE